MQDAAPLQAGPKAPKHPVCVTIAMDEIDQWDAASFHAEQAVDELTIEDRRVEESDMQSCDSRGIQYH